jgi:arylsulfatase A-like enzyme
VPFIVRWPAKIKPGVSDALVNQIDFIASFAAMFGQEIPAGHAIDSRNHLPALLGEDPTGLPYMVEEADTLALREGPWKFILGRKQTKGSGALQNGALYNLDEDIGESTNLISEHPGRAAEMKARLIAIRDAEAGIRSLN